ncbi:MAG: hypothetical protein ABIL01_33850 [Pseudomonadota bacterium]
MANRSSNPATPGQWVARLGGMLMALVAGKDQRLRDTIAATVARARPHDDLESMMHWHARHDPASNRRAE